MTDSRPAYRELSEREPAIPIFLRGWWLDATCGADGWDVVLVTKGEEIQAALPFRRRKRSGFVVLSQPMLTPFLGPWLRPTGAKKANDYSRQKELMTALIDGLPKHDHFVQNWSPQITNWLPFHWRGFHQTTGYTYALGDLSDVNALWSGLRENIRREIRRAQNRVGVTVTSEGSLAEFLKLNSLTFERQGRGRSYDNEYVARIDHVCSERVCRRIFLAHDSEGRAHAGAYVVWDQNSAYYLMGGGDPELRNSGATSLCMWEAIKFSAGVTRRFDFEGSMIEPVERFFRAFGAEQVPYSRVSKTPSRLLAAAQTLRTLVSR